jgi:hypothetical protein
MAAMRAIRFAALALHLAWAASAAAQDKPACLDAASQAQKLRSAHSLVEARAQLRICSSATCPAAVQSDCAGWLVQVEESLPTVVVSAKNQAGADLLEVTVTVDGTLLASKLDGQAVPMDPGPHAFRFEAADGSVLEERVLVREGEKNQGVAVVLQAPPAATQQSPSPTLPNADSGASAPPWRTLGWIAMGVGVVGVGVGATFGIVALHDKNTAGCNANDVCAPGTTGAIKSAALASDLGLITGSVLLAGGAALVIFAPKRNVMSAGVLRIAPSLISAGGGAVLEGAW